MNLVRFYICFSLAVRIDTVNLFSVLSVFSY